MDLKAKYLSEHVSDPVEFLRQLRQTTEPIGGGTEYREDGELVEYHVAVEAVKKANNAFIEKALKWYCLDCECNDNCKDTKCFFYREFERYLNGNEHALPPKISNSMLDEDGFISDNWRYRHFTKKIQDVFIEKACEFLKDHMAGYDICEDDIERSVESFKLAMRL